MSEHDPFTGVPEDPGVARGRDTERDIRAAFDGLRHDSARVDTMAALRELEGKRRWVAPAALGGAVAALLLIVGLVVFTGDDDGAEEVTTADEGGADEGADDGASDDGAGIDGADLLARLEGTSWVLVEGTGPDGPIPLVDGWPITMAFDGGIIGGKAPCNGYGGEASVGDDGSFVIGMLGSEGEACGPQEVMESEAAFLDAIARIGEAELAADGEVLRLTGAEVDLIFALTAPVPDALFDTRWVLDSLVLGDGAVEPAQRRPALLLSSNGTLADGTVTGGTGCREISGSWIVNGAEVLFTSFSAAGECEATLADQDGHIVTVLGDGFTAEIADDGRLVLSSQGGLGLVYRPGEGDGGEPDDEGDSEAPASVPAATTFDDLGCGEAVTAAGLVDGTTPDHVREIVSYESADCRRSVFLLGTDLGGEPTDADLMLSWADNESISLIEGTLPGVTLSLPRSFGIDAEGADLLDTSVGVAALTQDPSGSRQLYVDHGGPDSTVTFLDSPARVVVDTPIDPASVPVPVVGEVVLPRPIRVVEAGTPVAIRGLGRPFEATGSVSLRRAPVEGNEPGTGIPVEAVWSGFAALGDSYEGSRYGYYTASIDAWGEFSIAVEGLAPGTYEILFENFAPEESGSAGTYVTFVVGGNALAVEGEGLAVVDAESGSVRRLPFGSPAEQVLELLDRLLGPSERTNSSPECPNQADRAAFWPDAGLQIELRGGELIAWSLRPESPLTTLAGIGVGSTRSELEGAYVIELVESTLGVEFATGPDPAAPDAIRGLLSGRRDQATITSLWAGEICAFR